MVMLIDKEETVELCARQLAFFSYTKTGPTIVTKLSSTEQVPTNGVYSYEYIVGRHTTPNEAYRYLHDHVWWRVPLPEDLVSTTRDDQLDYINYLSSIYEQPNEKVLTVLEQMKKLPCLVHGDATLENLIKTPTEVVPIDPGFSRGFNCVENDLGKILQSVLTYWSWVCTDDKSCLFSVKDLPFHVTTETMCSLISHWYRIVKNANRHRPFVLRYATKQAIPTLEEAVCKVIACTGYDGGYRWSDNRLKAVHHQLLPKSF